ncbi:cell division protein SepF [Methanobacterium alcaliphilum]|uniref:cell division protein SepF n=1 Tax=Methanobacterium alcaliphilum TaxID=392018 RepID=UPI00200AEBC8|nr:cell division protein SepF [Methanobacterium alcaliphilum]MCK9151229.1 cell division protein SepF [Methanobacterium alcaliphilum]
MKDVMDFVKKNLGLDEDEEQKEEQEPIIVPEHSFYEIVLMKAKNSEDIDYAIAQITEEKNPIILDLSYLENESPDDLRIAGEKLKALRKEKGVEAILLCQNGKNIVIITPPEIKLIRKD